MVDGICFNKVEILVLVCIKWKILLINNKIFCLLMLWKYFVIVRVVRFICIWVLGGLFICLYIRVILDFVKLDFWIILDFFIFMYKLFFLWVCLLILLNIEILLCVLVILLINFMIKIVLLIFVLLNKLILFLWWYGVKRFIILIFVLKIDNLVFKFIKVGVVLWIVNLLVEFIGLRLFIGCLRILKICFNVGFFIGIVNVELLLIIFILCINLLVVFIDIVWI